MVCLRSSVAGTFRNPLLVACLGSNIRFTSCSSYKRFRKVMSEHPSLAQGERFGKLPARTRLFDSRMRMRGLLTLTSKAVGTIGSRGRVQECSLKLNETRPRVDAGRTAFNSIYNIPVV